MHELNQTHWLGTVTPFDDRQVLPRDESRLSIRMQEPITIVCFKWKRNTFGMQLPHVCDYTFRHVNALKNSVMRNSMIAHRFICITDDWRGIDADVEIVQLWDKCMFLGGCYNRLYVFAEKMTEYVGARFVCMDLDTVVVGNIDSVLARTERFIINRYRLIGPGNATHQFYNGGLFMMDTGCRKQVWETFDAAKSVEAIRTRISRGELCGSDQAWVSHVLGGNEAVFTDADGVLDYRLLSDRQLLPRHARIVMFPGRRDPSLERNEVHWIREHWD